MERQVEIKRAEVVDLMMRNHRYSILRTLQKIVEDEPDRIKDFGFAPEDFDKVSDELKEAEIRCNNWWIGISEKYNLPLYCKFRVRYDSNMVTVEE